MSIRYFINNAVISRLLILAIDLLVCITSFFFANMLRFNFLIPDYVYQHLRFSIFILVLVRIIPFYIFKTYSGIIKYTGEQDAKRVVFAVGIGSAILFTLNKIVPECFELFLGHREMVFFFPVSILLIDFVVLSFSLVFYKVSVKVISEEIRYSKLSFKNPRHNIAIFGAGKAGLLTKKAIDQDKSSNMVVNAFIDDDVKISGKSIDGVRIWETKDLEQIIEKHKIQSVIISTQLMKPERKEIIVDFFLAKGIKVMSIPPVNQWLSGELDFSQIREINIEDLLDREPIKLDNQYLKEQIDGKVILISGAAGSIGSEIVKQITILKPKTLILVDFAESPLVDLALEIEENYKISNLVPIIADVTNEARMEQVFVEYKPDLVYHAAAYKHVPAMENYPSEAVRVNVFGSKLLADLSIKYGADKFVMVSTDKAVNPTNVMGCSKRIAEIYIQSLNNLNLDKKRTRFITTRFGNVLGSNGSVIPRFKKQILAGGPITVTHPDITRYFMTIPEACQLVLEAGLMGKGGEIFVFDMGKSVKILDLAERMIRLSGFTPYKDIHIVFSGLRPGEKIEEELLSKKENIIPTHHHKIMKGKVREYDFEEVNKSIENLKAALETLDSFKIVDTMKKIVPEFKSNNSVFEKLD